MQYETRREMREISSSQFSFRNPDGVEQGRDKWYRSYHATVTAAAAVENLLPLLTTTHNVPRLAHFHLQQYRQGRSRQLDMGDIGMYPSPRHFLAFFQIDEVNSLQLENKKSI